MMWRAVIWYYMVHLSKGCLFSNLFYLSNLSSLRSWSDIKPSKWWKFFYPRAPWLSRSLFDCSWFGPQISRHRTALLKESGGVWTLGIIIFFAADDLDSLTVLRLTTVQSLSCKFDFFYAYNKNNYIHAFAIPYHERAFGGASTLSMRYWEPKRRSTVTQKWRPNAPQNKLAAALK